MNDLESMTESLRTLSGMAQSAGFEDVTTQLPSADNENVIGIKGWRDGQQYEFSFRADSPEAVMMFFHQARATLAREREKHAGPPASAS